MPKYTIRGTETIDVVYTIEAPNEGEAWEKLDACLNNRDWYPDEDGNKIPCDPDDFTREHTGGPMAIPDSWELFDESGERLL